MLLGVCGFSVGGGFKIHVFGWVLISCSSAYDVFLYVTSSSHSMDPWTCVTHLYDYLLLNFHYSIIYTKNNYL